MYEDNVATLHIPSHCQMFSVLCI